MVRVRIWNINLMVILVNSVNVGSLKIRNFIIRMLNMSIYFVMIVRIRWVIVEFVVCMLLFSVICVVI